MSYVLKNNWRELIPQTIRLYGENDNQVIEAISRLESQPCEFTLRCDMQHALMMALSEITFNYTVKELEIEQRYPCQYWSNVAINIFNTIAELRPSDADVIENQLAERA